MKKPGLQILFMLPAFLIFSVFIVIPMLSSFYFSLTDWNGLNPHSHFIGLKNYQNIIHDSEVWIALKNTIIFAILVTVLQNILSLVLAMLLDGAGWLARFLRVFYLIPALLSALAIGFVWSYMYNPVFGVINMALENIGLGSWAQDWLGDPKWSMYSVVFTNIWQWTGLSLVIYLAGLQAIPGDLYEAADIDGANRWHQFKQITFPLIAPAFTVNILISIIGSFKVFDIIFVMTKGGPGTATESLAILLYKKAFNYNEMGYGTAIAIVMFFIILFISVIQLRILRRREIEA
ncbi:sugar ABC transporter permease [Paenibacillus sp. HN-1]|uniref:carbohydrate ABC transporter permease n=1 Tax=Paenibacillus sp. CGMCC 1.18879 TaxID=2834466 RepID=UPI001CAA0827|nr:sugar ABC transporter permease [Paenibacillus sp. CGMCC 1.18879]MBY9080724.1 sugar ABC transporter permease [Paenibacillus sp. CGMCC 1.18879]MBY9085284.1 sugar ABC transporter permease [Paenibacillus sinensis]